MISQQSRVIPEIPPSWCGGSGATLGGAFVLAFPGKRPPRGARAQIDLSTASGAWWTFIRVINPDEAVVHGSIRAGKIILGLPMDQIRIRLAQMSLKEAAALLSDLPVEETPTVSLSLLFFLCLLLRGLAGLHYILQKNIWEESEVARSLHVFWFHQDLGWLSCLRSPTFRHAVDHFVIRVSPDISASFLCLWSLLILLSSVPSFLRSDARSCHRYLEPNDCSAPILLLF